MELYYIRKGRIAVKTKNRETYLDILRIISMLAVIMIHITCNIVASLSPSSGYRWYYGNFFLTLSRFSVPIFIMISGKIFLTSKKVEDIKYLYKKILHLIIILITWGIFYNLLEAILKNRQPFQLTTIRHAISLTFLGTTRYHLWYLYVIIGLYIITPILRVFIKHASKKELEYFLITWFIFVSILPFLTHFHIFRHLLIFTHFDVAMISGYIGYYVLGYYLDTNNFDKKEKKWIYILGILGFLFTFGTVLINYYRLHQYDTFLHTYMMPGIIFMSIALFLFTKETCNTHVLHDRLKKILSILANVSLGVYLVHDVFLSYIFPFGIRFTIIYKHTWILLPAYFLLISICSILTSWILSKIPVIKKYFI